MRAVFRVFWEAAKDAWEEMFLLALMNIVTALLLLPVVTFPPALAGLWSVANLVVQGKGIAWSDYFGGFRRYFKKALGLALINILVLATLLINIYFYVPGNAPFKISENLSFLIRAFWVSATFLWLALQMYPLALLIEQEDQRLRVALRNAAVLLFAHPGFSLVLVVLILIVSAISVVIPALWVLVTLGFLAVLCNKAVRHLLEPYRERAERELQEAAADEADEADEEELEEEDS